MLKRGIAWVSIALICVSASALLADGPVDIGTILKNPESYYLHVVTLAGTVRHVKVILPPSSLPQSCGGMEGGGGRFYSPITFTLEDETGSIVVDRMGICWVHGLKVPEVTEGEKVIIEALILGPDQDAEQRMDIPARSTTHAVVKNIRRP